MSVHPLPSAPVSLDELIAARLEQLLADAVQTVLGDVQRGGVERTHLTVAETAQAMGCTRSHIYKLVDAGTIPSVRLGTKIVVPVAALRALGLPPP